MAPLAAIPLIGSAALTTFTTLFATGAYAGKRKKRETQDIALQDTNDDGVINDKIQLVHQYHSNQMENIPKEQYDRNANSTNSDGLYRSGSNDWKVLNPIGINHGQKKSDNRFVKFSIEDATLNHRYPKNPFENYYYHNNSLKSNIGNITSLEIVWEEDDKRYKDMLSSGFLGKRDQQHEKQYKDMLSLYFVGKRDQHDLEKGTNRKEEDKIFHKELPYRKKQVVEENSSILKKRNDSLLLLEINEWKKKDKKKLDNDSRKLHSEKVKIDSKNAFGKINVRDLDSRETEIVISNRDKVAKRNDRSDPNSWIPFLSNPYLVS